ncbi:MAG: hypothetical protein QM756_46010 [Polyangiaceae bacterium]
MNSDPSDDDLVDALRDDLPSNEHEARMRARLAAIGVFGAGSVASTAASAGALAQVAALSASTKLSVVALVTLGVGATALTLQSAPAPRSAASAPVGVLSAPALARRAPIAPKAPRAVPAANSAVPAPVLAETPRAPAVVVQRAPAAVDNPPVLSAPPRSAAPSEVAFAADEPVTAAPASPTPTPAPVPSTLREETALIDAALLAMRAGERERARALLDQHQQRFPNGLLQRERERARARLDQH